MHGEERANKPGRGGYALIELTVALLVITVSIGAISMSMMSTSSLSRSNEERTRAIAAALSVLESIRSEDPGEVFARFNRVTSDDPASGVSPGSFFSVGDLEPRRGDADGFVGEVQFPGDGVVLREDVLDVELGVPRDLNSDGEVDGDDRSTDYTVLPVRIRVEWTGVCGGQKVDLYSMIGRL